MSSLSAIIHNRDMSWLGAHFRKQRSRHIRALIDKIHAEHGQCRILDIGGEGLYWKIFDADYLHTRRVHVTITNLEYDPNMAVDVDPEVFTFSIGNGCKLSYPDQSFDLVHANSVIEHVGEWLAMIAFAKECRRLAPCYYVQMPYFWFPLEPHFRLPFFHWLPEPIRVHLVTQFALGPFPKAESLSRAVEWVQNCHLLGRRQFEVLFPDAVIQPERVAGMIMALIAIRRA